jgi:4-hydroxy-3-polyprenylbenzoate decarboxylase
MPALPLPPGADRIVVGVTGASGSIYAHRLIAQLLEREFEVFLVASTAARQVIQQEIPEHAGASENIFRNLPPGRLRVFREKDFFAPFCSGSFPVRAVVIVPASMGTIGAIASGYAANSIHRAADVALKEKFPLLLVPRETPLSSIHLENLLRLSRAGAIILPPMPAFYQHPKTIDDQINFVVSRILDQLGIPNRLYSRWQENP